MLLRSRKQLAPVAVYTKKPVIKMPTFALEPPNTFEKMKCRDATELRLMRKRRDAFEARLDECQAKYISPEEDFDNWLVYIRERFELFIANFADLVLFEDTNERCVCLYMNVCNEVSGVNDKIAKKYTEIMCANVWDVTEETYVKIRKTLDVVKIFEDLFKND